MPPVTRKQQAVALVIAALSIVTAGSFTTLSGLLTAELAGTAGWTTTTTAPGVAINMILYGASAPFAIHAMNRYGIRVVTVAALGLLIAGSGLCITGNVLLYNLGWGFVVGVGCGTLTMAYGAFIARLWFEKSGTPTGFLTAAAVTGQFALLPVWAELSHTFGWRTSLIGSSVLAAVTIAATLLFLRERTAGLQTISNRYLDRSERLNDVLKTIWDAASTPTFWVIVIHFAMCGATTNGLMWSNFTPAAQDQGLGTAAASTILLLIGIFNIPGTIASGWLCDRVSNRAILAAVFCVRAVALLTLPFILGSTFSWQLVLFGIAFGVFDVATVPPVIALCNRVFGSKGPSVFAWVNTGHQVGAGWMALVGSGIKATTGSFTWLWFFAAAMSLSAAIVVYMSQYPSLLNYRYQSITGGENA